MEDFLVTLLSLSGNEVGSHTAASTPVTDGNRNIWRWVTARPDVSVGVNGRWNHLSLDQLLSIPENEVQSSTDELPSETTSGHRLSPGMEIASPTELPTIRPRLYVSESKMWSCLTGHGIDYQKVTRFEWLALVGIASVMEEGILQGDLTRLVGQDKRSLPKRTDALARKGYIVKRPILARGCKTSKLWLKPFTPSVQIQKHSTETITEICNADFPRDAIVGDLEPVPWRHHWSGDTIDYATLGRSIMGVVKEFGVIRYQDLRMKLGVAGHPWQMKVVTRTCRFFIELGLLQYVTASMGNRIFRDCIKFKRDITPEDLVTFISGGGSAFKFGNNHEPKKLSTKMPKDDAIRSSPTENWCPDKPLTTAVLEVILSSGPKGITNKGLAFNTIGVFFERHVSAVSTAVSLRDTQPSHLRQFRARKEYCRSGRFAFYKFFPDDVPTDSERLQPEGNTSSPTGPRLRVHGVGSPEVHDAETIYGFGPPQGRSPGTNFRPAVSKSVTDGRKRPSQFDLSSSRKKRKLDVMGPDPSVPEPSQATPNRKRGRPRKDPTGETVTKLRRKPSSTSNRKPFTCDKCGGSWKNDVGLKYHQRKSKTSCNPAFIAKPLTHVVQPSRRNDSRKALGVSSRAVESKALINFKSWKGDATMQIRTCHHQERPASEPAANCRLMDDTNEISLPTIGQYTHASFIGGVIDHHLTQAKNGPAGVSNFPVGPNSIGGKRHQTNRKTKDTSLNQSPNVVT